MIARFHLGSTGLTLQVSPKAGWVAKKGTLAESRCRRGQSVRVCRTRTCDPWLRGRMPYYPLGHEAFQKICVDKSVSRTLSVRFVVVLTPHSHCTSRCYRSLLSRYCHEVHSSVVRAADCRSAGPWFKSGCAQAGLAGMEPARHGAWQAWSLTGIEPGRHGAWQAQRRNAFPLSDAPWED